jgi:hypothetical protein
MQQYDQREMQKSMEMKSKVEVEKQMRDKQVKDEGLRKK